MLQLRKIKKVFTNFPRGFWRFPTKFQRFKNSAVLEPRTGQFSRTYGLETSRPRPRTLKCVLEAKAKDFRMCPRGQGRPLGLHLCLLAKFFLPNPDACDLLPAVSNFAAHGHELLVQYWHTQQVVRRFMVILSLPLPNNTVQTFSSTS